MSNQRATRLSFRSTAANFSNPRISFDHYATGISFSIKGQRMNVSYGCNTIGTKYLGSYDDPRTQATPTSHACFIAAAKWLNENPEIVQEYLPHE